MLKARDRGALREGKVNVRLEASHVKGNTAGTQGGGTYITGTALTLIGASRIDSNKADNGGGIFMGGGTSVELEGGTVVSANKATDQGGGIFRESGEDTIIEEPGWIGRIARKKPDNIFTER